MTELSQEFFPPFKLSLFITPYRLEQFLEKEAKTIYKHEFIDGQIFKMPYAKGLHNIISANLVTEMNISLRKIEKNYLIFPSDQMEYFPILNQSVYAGDFAVCEKPLYRNDSAVSIIINPIFIVEVLSKISGTPPASKYDRTSKFDIYKTLESIREYVLIRQDECYAEVWYRESSGRWQETIVTDIKSELLLQSVGIKIAMEWIYKNVELKDK